MYEFICSIIPFDRSLILTTSDLERYRFYLSLQFRQLCALHRIVNRSILSKKNDMKRYYYEINYFNGGRIANLIE